MVSIFCPFVVLSGGRRYPFCCRHQPTAAPEGTVFPLQLLPWKKVVPLAGSEVDIVVEGVGGLADYAGWGSSDSLPGGFPTISLHAGYRLL